MSMNRIVTHIHMSCCSNPMRVAACNPIISPYLILKGKLCMMCCYRCQTCEYVTFDVSSTFFCISSLVYDWAGSLGCAGETVQLRVILYLGYASASCPPVVDILCYSLLLLINC